MERQRDTTPLSPFFFDILHLNGEDLIDRPASERLRILREQPEPLRVPHTVAEDAQTAERFLDDALAHGHEGVMVKALDAPYEAGRRGRLAQGQARTHWTWWCLRPNGATVAVRDGSATSTWARGTRTTGS